MSTISNSARLFLTISISLTCLSFYTLPAIANGQPNVLLIYVDDLGYGDTGVYGHPIVKTPNIDRLAEEGLKFTQFYAPSALCSPSRAGLLTGRTPYRTGVQSWIPDNSAISLGENEITIAALLKEQGYRTAAIGKWHLNGGLEMKDSPQARDFGFDYQYGLAAWVKNAKAEKAGKGKLFPDNMYRNNKAVGETTKFSAELISDEAIKWIGEDSEPFFMYLTYSEVHTPIASPKHFTKQYDEYLTDESRDNPWTYYFNWADKPYRGKGEYYANISYMDAQMGRVIEFLRKHKQLDNTLVIFSSDNGPVTVEAEQAWELSMAGETAGLRGKKRYLFEGGLRVPGIIRYPSIGTQGDTISTPVTALDIMPTIANFVGAKIPSDRPIDGQSLMPLFTGKETKSNKLKRQKVFYWSIPTPDGMEFAIRDGDWKLILDNETKPQFLFNLKNDFYEVHNLINTESERVSVLLEKFKKYKTDIDNDPVRKARYIAQ